MTYYCEKNCSSDWANFKKSLEQFFGTDNGMDKVWVPEGPRGLGDSRDLEELEDLEGSSKSIVVRSCQSGRSVYFNNEFPLMQGTIILYSRALLAPN